MMKYLKNMRWIAMVMAFVIALNTLTLVVEAKGKSKTYHYVSSMTAEKSNDDSSFGNIYKFKLKKNKLTVWGSFTRYNSTKKLYSEEGKYISYKKRTFTLSKKVKYYCSGGETTERLTKKQFKKFLKWNGNGLGFRMVVKNKKVVKIYFES